MSARTIYSAPIPLLPEHNVDNFDCGKPVLDAWLKRRAFGNEGRASRTYVVLLSAGEPASEVVGYYALATGAAALKLFRTKHRHNLPDPVPVVVLARLATDHRHHGRGIGRALLREALRRTLDISRSAGVRALLVHAIDEKAAAFYQLLGFQPAHSDEQTLYLLTETIAATL